MNEWILSSFKQRFFLGYSCQIGEQAYAKSQMQIMTRSCRFKKLCACEACRLKPVPSSTNSRLVFLPVYWPLSHRIPPVSVTNSLKVTFQMLHKLIACLLVSVSVMVMFLCLERLMHYQLVLLFLLWESPFSLLGRDMSLYEGGHYKENCVIRNSDFSFHT